jgi:predicted secreted protein
MKKFTSGLFFLIFVLSTSFCLAEGSKTPKVIKARVGHDFTITQESNGTTGYLWQFAKPLDRSALKLMRSEYISAKNKPNMQVGTPGKQMWRFNAIKPGRTSIYFEYVRLWGKIHTPQNEESYLIDIKQ